MNNKQMCMSTDDTVMYSPESQPAQAFRVRGTPAITYLTTRPDKKSGHFIILWDRIQLAFSNAKCIMNGNTLVDFLTDDDFTNLLPLRIRSHPNIVLDVILDSAVTGTAVGTEVADKASNPSHTSLQLHNSESLETTSIVGHKCKFTEEVSDIDSQLHDVADLSAVTAEVIGETINDHSTTIAIHNQSSLQPLAQLQSSYIKAAFTGQLPPAASLNDTLQERFSSSGLQINDVILTDMMKNQRDIMQSLTQIMSQQVMLHNRVESLSTQNYELHEYPIPRLFVVLQKPKRHRDMIGNPFKKQFRLFFLCECGEHTMKDGTRNPHEIHLARHEGYDVSQPTEFFKKYGSYVVTIMKVLKYGIAAAGFVVPTLGHLVNGIEEIQKSFSIAAHEVRPLIEDTIRHIKHEIDGPISGVNSIPGPTGLDELEVLEGADLRLLESFLQVKDQGRTLGNLFRITTLNGHVKWVCIDHYHENYRQRAQRELKDVVKANGGSFEDEGTTVYVMLRSAMLAKQFYQVLEKAKGVHKLYISLAWEATHSDFLKFAAAMAKANIAVLEIFGLFYEAPALDFINNARRYDPILGLMTNGRIIDISIKFEREWPYNSPRKIVRNLKRLSFDRFYQHIGKPSMMVTQKLKNLRIEPMLSLDNPRSRAIVARILKHCPALESLWILVDDLSSSMPFFKDKALLCTSLRLVTLFHMHGSLEARFVKGKFEKVKLVVKRKEGVSSEIEDLWREGYLSEVEIDVRRNENEPVEKDFQPSKIQESQVLDVIRCNPHLSSISVKQEPTPSVLIIESMISIRDDILSTGRESALKEAVVAWSEHVRESTYCFDFHAETNIVFGEGESEPEITTRINMTGVCGDHKSAFLALLPLLLQQYGWSVTDFCVTAAFNNNYAVIFDRVTEEKGSNLCSLDLVPTSLTSIGIDCMDRIIERSANLDQFCLNLRIADIHMVERIVRQHGSIITELFLMVGVYGIEYNKIDDVEFDDNELDELVATLSRLGITRHNLPALQILSLYTWPYMTSNISNDSARWIAGMISAAHQQEDLPTAAMAATLINENSSQSMTPHPPHQPGAWKSLKDITISGLWLEPQGWQTFVMSLDFSVLEKLSISCTNFSLDHLEAMVDHAQVGTYIAIDLIISLEGNYNLGDYKAVDEQAERLEKNLPHARVIINE